MKHVAVPVPGPARGRVLAAFVALLLLVGLTGGGLPQLAAEPADAAECPCSIWPSTATPGNPSTADTSAVELGVKFRSDVAGYVTGIRFYKGSGNTGTHVGNLWTTDGTNLGSATFTAESSTGWQQVAFPSPIAITAGTTYVASYYAPNGGYAADNGAFATAGVDRAPLAALADGVDGANGVYRYGTGGGFPANTWNSTNYWVDVVFEATATDTVAPTLTARAPAPDSTIARVDSKVTGTFNEPVTGAAVAVTGPAGAVAGTTTYDAATTTVTFTPDDALATSTTYTASASGATDAAGNAMTADSWSFTTAATADGCPCSLWPSTATPATASASDSSAVEVGTRFRADSDGHITGLRFYKGSANTGTHVGNLWTATGTLLSSATFSAESATGWQEITLPSPVAITAGTDYVASYHAPNGGYALDGGYFTTGRSVPPLSAPASSGSTPNGVYRYGASGFPASTYNATNYWVDVVFAFSAADTTPPSITGKSPVDGATEVSVETSVTATFSEAVTADSVSLTLADAGGSVAGTVTYDSTSRTATLKPSASLKASTTYSASASATDTAGNAMTAPATWSFTTAAPPPPSTTMSGPVLVVAPTGASFAGYLPEILKTEGLNAFTKGDLSALNATDLAKYDVVVLGETALTAAQVTALTDWVTAGGNLITMRPDEQLAGLLGLAAVTSGSTTLAEGYVLVDTSKEPGAGITGETMQYHGTADRYTMNGATAVATLYSDPTTATVNPAVTLRTVGTAGGQAAAFTYDLARSVVYTRQGNPAYAGLERDGATPIRSDDMFWGSSPTNGYVNLDKVKIPQADEQQRLLANLVQTMNRDNKPLPRFWYFPRDAKAVVMATGDDHGNNGTAGRYDQYDANSTPDCSVILWSCLRFTSYVYPGTPLSPQAATDYDARGFDTGAHVTSGCSDFTSTSLDNNYSTQLGQWKTDFPGLPSPTTNRFHCLVYSDWATQPKTERKHGMGMDTNYYYWPGSWVDNRPGFMTGSGMPMRFADADGSVIDSYQAATQLTDESGQSYPFTPDALLDNAQGALGYYGAFTANMHTDVATVYENDQMLASAQSRGVPVIAARQMLTWLKGRDSSAFTDLAWSSGTLSFGIAPGTGTTGLMAHLPTAGPAGTTLSSITRSGSSVPFTVQTVKGLAYASFPAASGSYTATYVTSSSTSTTSALRLSSTESGTEMATADTTTTDSSFLVRDGKRLFATDDAGTSSLRGPAPKDGSQPAADTTPPVLSALDVLSLPDGTATVSWRSDEGSDSEVRYGRSASNLDQTRQDRRRVAEHSVVLTGLEPGQTYHYAVRSADASGNVSTSRTARFVQSAAGVADTTAASLRMGQRDGAGFIGSRRDGEIELAGDDVLDFRLPELSGRWTTGVEDGGRARVHAGKLSLDGMRASGPSVDGPRSLEFEATFRGTEQLAGLASDGNGPSAMFAGRGGELYATITNGRNVTAVKLPQILLDAPHRYRVEWTSAGAVLSVDDVEVARGPLPLAPMRPLLRDLKGDDAPFALGWLRESNFRPSSTYVSRVLDAQQMVTWDRATWRATVPDGTAVKVSVRTGSRRSPDGTWSAWTSLSGPGARVVGEGRYLQYRVELTTARPTKTPVLEAIGFTHNGTLPDHEKETE